MSKLRPSKVPGKKAGPNGSFPIGDKKHARLAIGGATRSYNAGNISKSTETRIKSEARAKLDNTKGSAAMAKGKVPAAFKAHEFKKGVHTNGDLAKGKPAPKHHTPASGKPSHHDHVVKMFGGGNNPGRK